MIMIDMHCHVLPDMDDGASSVEEAVEILRAASEQGVKTIVATPHFYCSENSDAERFLKKREESFEKLRAETEKCSFDVPDIVLGAEVAISQHIINIKGLDKLTIGNTRYILLELPYGAWGEWIFDYIYKIMSIHGLRPVMAHIERYVANRLSGLKRIEKLLNMDVAYQVNTDSFSDRKMLTVIKKLIKRDALHVIGSDTHNTTDRPMTAECARSVIIKKFGEEFFGELNENASLILENKYL